MYNAQHGISLESFNTFIDAITTDSTAPKLTFENLFDDAGSSIGCQADIMRARKAVMDLVTTNNEISAKELEKLPEYISNLSDKSFVLTIDIGVLFQFLCYEVETIAKMIKQISNIPDDCTLYVFTELPFGDINWVMMFDGVAIANLIATAKCKKVYKFGSSVSLSDLLIASRCDEVHVGDFATISITKADNGSRITKFLTNMYRDLISSIYNHWIDKGLFTRTEVDDLFNNEAENSIMLLSDEIRHRFGAIR